jgi:hypothetical protein
MTSFTRVASRATVLGALGVCVLAPATALADSGSGACDAYSHNCIQPSHSSHPFRQTRVLPFHEQRTLPFTGAEIGAMSIAGVAAIGGGAVLVAAGRRRRLSTSPAA